METKHLSSEFDKELNKISSSIMTMGGNVEEELKLLTKVFIEEQYENIRTSLIKYKKKIEKLEIKLDARLVTIILRRQPTAIDLRLLVSISKILMYLSNINAEISKITSHAKDICESKIKALLPLKTVTTMLEKTLNMLHNTLDYFARLDVYEAAQLLCENNFINDDFNTFARELITYIMEDAKTISCGLNLVVITKSLERVVDQIIGINQQIIYIVKGINVNHLPKEKLMLLLENDFSNEALLESGKDND